MKKYKQQQIIEKLNKDPKYFKTGIEDGWIHPSRIMLKWLYELYRKEDTNVK